MKYVDFGNTGQRVSTMCLGTMMFGDRCDEEEAERIVDVALDHGVNFIDTAAMYCDGLTEQIIGRVLKRRRDTVFLATKVHKGIDGRSIENSIEESLIRLQTDYVDLYLIHWPQRGMNPTEVMRALEQVVLSGKARYVGCCNYPAWLLAHSNNLAERSGWSRLVCNQIPYNLIERGVEVEILPQAAAENLAITTYRPLLIGLLTGKYQVAQPLPIDSRASTDPRISAWLGKFSESLQAFEAYAASLNRHPAELAIAWLHFSDRITASIVGVSSAAQLRSILPAYDVELSAGQFQEVTRLFDTDVKEEAGGAFPSLRRAIGITP